nr:uncharacterized protein LOC117274525 [Nicotiana tomentosiformis]
MGLEESSGVELTTFQLTGSVYRWWQTYETPRDELRSKFEQLRQGCMTLSEYALRFAKLSCHAPSLVSKDRERESVGLLRDSSIASSLESSRRLESIRVQERRDKEAKNPRGSGGFSGSHSSASTHHGRGFVSQSVQSVLRIVTLAMLGLPRLEGRGSLGHVPSRVVSFLKTQPMIKKGCLAYLAFVRHVSDDIPMVDSVSVVREFPDVFPADLPDMPSDRDMDFGIELVSSTHPISIPPYRMALA